MSESPHVVVHTAPDGRSLPITDSRGQLLLFREAATAKCFARGLVEVGLPEAILVDLRDLDLLGGPTPPGGGDVAVFEESVAELSAEERLEKAHKLALDLGSLLLRRH